MFFAFSSSRALILRFDAAIKYELHEDRYDCLDAFVAVVRGGYGLIIHDGGHSVVEINFCPWCSTKFRSQQIPQYTCALAA